MIDDVAALRQRPELLDGYQLQNCPTIFWKMPSEKASPDNIVLRLSQLIADSEEFLRIQALPALREQLN
jgi:hypothetical protein